MSTFASGVLCILMLLCTATTTCSATSSTPNEQKAIVATSEVKEIFTDSIVASLGITIPIRVVYRSSDTLGIVYTILAESIDSVAEGQDTIHRTIQAVSCRFDAHTVRRLWSIRDHTRTYAVYDAHKHLHYERENSIWFWTKYCELIDVDGDGFLDPIIIYGANTCTFNGIDDARVNISLIHNGKRYTVYHQNSTMDSERHSRVDQQFYRLSPALRRAIISVMKRMEHDRTCIFPDGWERAFRRRALRIRQYHPWSTD